MKKISISIWLLFLLVSCSMSWNKEIESNRSTKIEPNNSTEKVITTVKNYVAGDDFYSKPIEKNLVKRIWSGKPEHLIQKDKYMEIYNLKYLDKKNIVNSFRYFNTPERNPNYVWTFTTNLKLELIANAIQKDFAYDPSNNVYVYHLWKWEKLESLDKKSFSILSSVYVKDKNWIYFVWDWIAEKLEWADLESFYTFEKCGKNNGIGYNYAKDKNQIYSSGIPIKINTKHFNPLEVWYLAWIDTKNFTPLEVWCLTSDEWEQLREQFDINKIKIIKILFNLNH